MTHTSVLKRYPTFQSVQYLRAVAALMVVIFHLRPRIERMGYAGSWPEWLGCGVDIFFVISGFIMWMTTCDQPIGPLDFVIRRFLRIAPIYYLVTAVVVALSLVAPSLVASGKFDLGHTIASFAFFPHFNPVARDFEPVLPQGWTLNYEMEFYALFAIALLAPARVRVWLIPASLLCIACLGVAAPDGTALWFYSSSIILEFGFGVMIGAALSSGARLPAVVALCLIVTGAVGIVLTWPLVKAGVPRVWLSGVSAALIIGGAVMFEAKRAVGGHKVLRLLGDASYSTYLTHGIVLSAVAFAWSKLPLSHSAFSIPLFVTVAILCASIGGIIVYRLAELPLHNVARHFGRRRQPPQAVPVVHAGLVQAVERGLARRVATKGR